LQGSSAQRGRVWLTSWANAGSATVEEAQPAQFAAPPAQLAQPPQLMTLGWALRRAALGLVILLTVAVLSAWLFYASIEPDGTAAPGARSEYALPSG
jgi:hypothetical protein